MPFVRESLQGSARFILKPGGKQTQWQKPVAAAAQSPSCASGYPGRSRLARGRSAMAPALHVGISTYFHCSGNPARRSMPLSVQNNRKNFP